MSYIVFSGEKFTAPVNIITRLPSGGLFFIFPSLHLPRHLSFYRPLKAVLVREVVYKSLGCGDLRKGFARIRCKSCHHEMLLAFSCKGRYFCPSCHQKRVLIFGEWITEEILYPLPHRQYVFTIPKMLRPYFRFDRGEKGSPISRQVKKHRHFP